MSIDKAFSDPISFWEYNTTIAVTLYLLFAIIFIPFIVVIIKAIIRKISGSKKPKVELRANIARPPEAAGEAFFKEAGLAPAGNSGVSENGLSQKPDNERLFDRYESSSDEDEDGFYNDDDDDYDDDDFYD